MTQTSTADFADRLHRFVRLITIEEPPSLPELAHALDGLAMLVHDLPAGALSDEDIDPPARAYEDYKTLYDSLGSRFPELGAYPVVEPVGELPAEPMYGDAIDDLADIVGDLSEVIWRYENSGPDEAIWYFHLHFQIHWGRHLRGLSLYLHVLMSTTGVWDGPYADEAAEAS